MTRTAAQLRDDALRIWQAGVAAVDSARLVQQALRVEGNELFVQDDALSLDKVGRIVVVGGGKAGAGMAAGLLAALGERVIREHRVSGFLNVPADCVRNLEAITLHAARAAGSNEPAPEGVVGAERMLELVAELEPDDLCITLISGGGSALLPAPAKGVTLADKLAVTRHLSAAGANIQELNSVRKQLSRIKGGGLARACRARRMIVLVISDVIGDPLEVIASGPTVPTKEGPEVALEILERFYPTCATIPVTVLDYLMKRIHGGSTSPASAKRRNPSCHVEHYIIGNCATAVDAAGIEAERLGYSHAMHVARQLEGEAEDVGRHLATMAVSMLKRRGPDCLISGGEPVVTLCDKATRGRGGRNQQLALAALCALEQEGGEGVLILSGGTDGEDGPTDAAGAWFDRAVLQAAHEQGLNPQEYLERNNAYTFFQKCGGLLKTGPTHTNVGDVRVVVVEREELAR